MLDWLKERPWHWWLPTPGLLVGGFVLVTSSKVWEEARRVTARGFSTTVPGRTYLFFLLATAAGYWATDFLHEYMPLPMGRIGMREPTVGEVGCSWALFRIFSLLSLYLLVVDLVRHFLL